MIQHFANERHALYAGMIIGRAMRNGVDVRPVIDDDGNYTARIWVGPLDVELIVPEPAEDWTMEDEL